MPICTTCTHPVTYLYTLYQSAYNLRLELCPNCKSFADPYVEHDPLILLLDLILLKRGVYRHLLFNRGAPPRRIGKDGDVKADEAEVASESHFQTICQLGATLVAVDAFIRWSHLQTENRLHDPGPATHSGLRRSEDYAWKLEGAESLLRTLLGCLVETVAFHLGIVLSSWVVLNLIEMVKFSSRKSSEHQPAHKPQFRLSHISLSLLYSSIIKLFLLLLLSIWRTPSMPEEIRPSASLDILSSYPALQDALRYLDDEHLDREWIIRNMLGGFSAGFGLRVVLECHPMLTTLIVLFGWAIKTAVAQWVSRWVSGQEGDLGETFLAYSIP